MVSCGLAFISGILRLVHLCHLLTQLLDFQSEEKLDYLTNDVGVILRRFIKNKLQTELNYHVFDFRNHEYLKSVKIINNGK